jgi:hypothetical protein
MQWRPRRRRSLSCKTSDSDVSMYVRELWEAGELIVSAGYARVCSSCSDRPPSVPARFFCGCVRSSCEGTETPTCSMCAVIVLARC